MAPMALAQTPMIFFPRNHFPEDEGCQNHGQYRRNGGDDGRIRRGSEPYAYREGHLVEMMPNREA